MSDEQGGGGGGRPSSAKAERLASGGGVGGAGGVGIGSGSVLGSKMTDTLGAEMGYGVDGKTDLTFFGKTYTFAPVGIDDQDEAATDLERLNTTLLAFGMANPTVPAEEVTSQDLAGMVRVLSGNPDSSELGACVNVALLFYNMTKEQRLAFTRLMWYSFRRWHEDIELTTVARFLDYANMPILLRLWFRKNLGVLDRFLYRLTQLMPPAPETGPNDLLTVETVNPEAFAALLSAETPDDDETEPIPATLSAEEAADVILERTQEMGGVTDEPAIPQTEQPTIQPTT